MVPLRSLPWPDEGWRTRGPWGYVAAILSVAIAAAGAVEVPVLTLRADAAVAYWTARYYLEHPETREDLVDGRAAARAAAYEFG